jgi:hypothetical protein
MSYYDTMDEDLQRAREILEKGKLPIQDPAFPYGIQNPGLEETSGTIYGADIYAAYKLIESFVKEIEDYAASFNLYHKASMALMRAYKQAHPEVPIHVWPDTSVVNEWAAQEIERLMALEAELQDAQERIAQLEAAAAKRMMEKHEGR